MAVNFREFVLENQNGIRVKVTLQAPPGTPPIIEAEIGPNTTRTFNTYVTDIQSVEIKVVAGGDEHTDIEKLELRGSPLPMFFETLQARTRIGSIQGQASTKFERR